MVVYGRPYAMQIVKITMRSRLAAASHLHAKQSAWLSSLAEARLRASKPEIATLGPSWNPERQLNLLCV